MSGVGVRLDFVEGAGGGGESTGEGLDWGSF